MGDYQGAGSEWSRYWSGRAGNDSSEVYAFQGLEADEELKDFWKGVISDFPKTARIADLACGAGSVIRHAHALGYSNLTGVDISPDAIALMQSRYPGVRGVVSNIGSLPFPEDSFDLLVSQFGFEYAGATPSLEAIAPALSKGGRFVGIVHMTEGAIARECRANKAACDALEDTGFIPAAMRVFEAYDTAERTGTDADKRALSAALEDLEAPRQAIADLAAKKHDLAGHTLSGTQIMFNRRRFYKLEDILDWLQRVKDENLAHAARMQGMVDASLTREQVIDHLGRLKELGFTAREPAAMMQGSPAEPIGWIFDATKTS